MDEINTRSNNLSLMDNTESEEEMRNDLSHKLTAFNNSVHMPGIKDYLSSTSEFILTDFQEENSDSFYSDSSSKCNKMCRENTDIVLDSQKASYNIQVTDPPNSLFASLREETNNVNNRIFNEHIFARGMLSGEKTNTASLQLDNSNVSERSLLCGQFTSLNSNMGNSQEEEILDSKFCSRRFSSMSSAHFSNEMDDDDPITSGSIPSHRLSVSIDTSTTNELERMSSIIDTIKQNISTFGQKFIPTDESNLKNCDIHFASESDTDLNDFNSNFYAVCDTQNFINSISCKSGLGIPYLKALSSSLESDAMETWFLPNKKSKLHSENLEVERIDGSENNLVTIISDVEVSNLSSKISPLLDNNMDVNTNDRTLSSHVIKEELLDQPCFKESNVDIINAPVPNTKKSESDQDATGRDSVVKTCEKSCIDMDNTVHIKAFNPIKRKFSSQPCSVSKNYLDNSAAAQAPAINVKEISAAWNQSSALLTNIKVEHPDDFESDSTVDNSSDNIAHSVECSSDKVKREFYDQSNLAVDNASSDPVRTIDVCNFNKIKTDIANVEMGASDVHNCNLKSEILCSEMDNITESEMINLNMVERNSDQSSSGISNTKESSSFAHLQRSMTHDTDLSTELTIHLDIEKTTEKKVSKFDICESNNFLSASNENVNANTNIVIKSVQSIAASTFENNLETYTTQPSHSSIASLKETIDRIITSEEFNSLNSIPSNSTLRLQFTSGGGILPVGYLSGVNACVNTVPHSQTINRVYSKPLLPKQSEIVQETTPAGVNACVNTIPHSQTINCVYSKPLLPKQSKIAQETTPAATASPVVNLNTSNACFLLMPCINLLSNVNPIAQNQTVMLNSLNTVMPNQAVILSNSNAVIQNQAVILNDSNTRIQNQALVLNGFGHKQNSLSLGSGTEINSTTVHGVSDCSPEVSQKLKSVSPNHYVTVQKDSHCGLSSETDSSAIKGGITEVMYKCSTCFKLFDSKKVVKDHQSVHEQMFPFKCNICNRSFTDAESRKSHIHYFQSYEAKKADLCSSIHSENRNDESHISDMSLLHLKLQTNSSTNIVPIYECETCGKKFYAKHNFEHHKITYCKRPTVLRCSVCFKIFPNSNALKLHEKEHSKLFVNDLVQSNVKNLNAIGTDKAQRNHKNKTSSIPPSNSNPEQKVLKHIAHVNKCEECGQKFYFKENFLRHKMNHCNKVSSVMDSCEKKHSRLVSKVSKNDLKAKSGSGNQPCNSQKLVVSPSHLLSSSNALKSGEKEHSLIYKVLGSGNIKEQEKRGHGTSHKHPQIKLKDTSSYKCQKCDKKFYLRQNFERHKINYHQIVYRCKVCTRVFHTSDQLHLHGREHLKLRPKHSNKKEIALNLKFRRNEVIDLCEENT